MDVRLLSGMIGELMLDADSLGLPGLGTFVAEDMPASFSDKGYTVNPPYRRLSFTSSQSDDGQLAALYAASNEGLSLADASSIISSFCSSLSEELKSRKSIDFPGLGRLRSTREGQLFFVPDADLDISPDACGLDAVSLKTHALSAAELPEVAPDLIRKKAQQSEEKLSEPLQTKVNEQQSVEKLAAQAVYAETNVVPDKPLAEPIVPKAKTIKPKRKIPKPLGWAIGVTCAAVLLLVAFVAVSRLAPDFTDRLLYTPEQLELLNTPIE